MAVKLTGGQAPEDESSDKIMLLGHGYPGVGKTAFGLSFPAPFWIFNLDRPMGELIKKLPVTHEVTYEAMPVDLADTSKAAAIQYLTKFDALLKDALAGSSDGTMLIDGWDIFWDLVKIARVNNLESDLPKEYAPANAYMNGILGRLGRSKLNVVFTTISSKVWSGAKTETDRVRADGFKHKDRMLTHEVYLFSPEDRRNPVEAPRGGDPTKAGETGQTHRALITMSKLNETLINRMIPNLSFALLYKLTFGQSYGSPERLWSPAKAAALVTEEAPAGAAT